MFTIFAYMIENVYKIPLENKIYKDLEVGDIVSLSYIHGFYNLKIEMFYLIEAEVRVLLSDGIIRRVNEFKKVGMFK